VAKSMVVKAVQDLVAKEYLMAAVPGVGVEIAAGKFAVLCRSAYCFIPLTFYRKFHPVGAEIIKIMSKQNCGN
jgi:hypothetical protein